MEVAGHWLLPRFPRCLHSVDLGSMFPPLCLLQKANEQNLQSVEEPADAGQSHRACVALSCPQQVLLQDALCSLDHRYGVFL